MTVNYEPGDIFLTHSNTFYGWLIRFGERIRDGKAASAWNHAGVIVDSSGTTVEAVGRGVVVSHMSAHPHSVVIDAGMTPQDREQVVSFAKSCVGAEYGYLDVVSIGFRILLRHTPTLHTTDSLICSELAARALEHGGWICPKLDTSEVMPSDLAKWFLPRATHK